MLDREHACSEDVEKTMHLRVHAWVKVAYRVMEAGSELDRHLVPAARHQSPRNLLTARKRVCRDSARSQLKARTSSGERFDGFDRAFWRCFPKSFQRQPAENLAGRA